jgi:hypothetical protein
VVIIEGNPESAAFPIPTDLIPSLRRRLPSHGNDEEGSREGGARGE